MYVARLMLLVASCVSTPQDDEPAAEDCCLVCKVASEANVPFATVSVPTARIGFTACALLILFDFPVIIETLR